MLYDSSWDDKGYKMAQCSLERAEENRTIKYTAWLPLSKISIGKSITIREHGSWVVKHIGSKAFSKYILKNERSYLNHRKATDI